MRTNAANEAKTEAKENTAREDTGQGNRRDVVLAVSEVTEPRLVHSPNRRPVRGRSSAAVCRRGRRHDEQLTLLIPSLRNCCMQAVLLASQSGGKWDGGREPLLSVGGGGVRGGRGTGDDVDDDASSVTMAWDTSSIAR